MCEIAIIDPSEYSTVEIMEFAIQIYESQRSSLGVALVYLEDDHFEYDVYRSTDPEMEELGNFFAGLTDVHRVIIHGRMATHGATIDEHSHPLALDCDECEIDYVVHNGIVGRNERAIEQFEENGHNLSTGVDSEMIAHQYGEIPERTDEDPGFFDREPGFVLMNETEIYVHANRHYHLTEDLRMATTWQEWAPERGETDLAKLRYHV